MINLPIEWQNKVNSPELLALLQNFGATHYLSAEEVNQLRDAINELYETTGSITPEEIEAINDRLSSLETLPTANTITAQTGFSLIGLDFTVNADWEWILENTPHTNPAPVVVPVTLCDAGKKRIDYIVPNNTNGFDLVPGAETTGIPAAPVIPNKGMYVTFFIVTDTLINEPSNPNLGNVPSLEDVINVYPFSTKGFTIQEKLSDESSNSGFHVMPRFLSLWNWLSGVAKYGRVKWDNIGVNVTFQLPNTADNSTEILAILSDVEALETAVDDALALKVDKVTGKGLSPEEYSLSEKNKLASIDATHYLPPLQTTVQLSALVQASIADKARVYVENDLADYFYDATASSGDIAPDDQAGGVGFWRKVAVGGETPTSVMTKYESNADRNALTDTLKSNYDTAYTHSQSTHAPTDAQKNSDITKAEIEAKLTGEITTHTHPNDVTISQDVEADKASTTSVSSVKALYDWAVSKFKLWAYSINTQAGTTYTFAIDDYKKHTLFTSATAVTVTIPTNAVTAIPIGSEIAYQQRGAGVVTVGGAGVTINTNGSLASSLNETKVLIKTNTNEWTLMSCTNGDMVLGTAQTVTETKTFLSGKLALRNAANTFTSFFVLPATASRTVTFQDKSYTVADNADVVTKMALPTGGTANYLPKFLTATTMGLSRLWDTGSYFGIGTFNTPSKDITLGNQADRALGVENSDNSTVGRDFDIEAGSTINYVPSNQFVTLNEAGDWSSIKTHPNGDIIAVRNSGGAIYKQVGGSGAFVLVASHGYGYTPKLSITPNGDIYMGTTSAGYPLTISTNNGVSFTPLASEAGRLWICFASTDNGNTYGISTSGLIFMRTGNSGAFVDLGEPARTYNLNGICAFGNNVYLFTSTDIYKQTGGTGAFVGLGQISRGYVNPWASLTGDIYCSVGTAIYKQTSGAGNFVLDASFTAISGQVTCAQNGDYYALQHLTGIYRKQNSGVGTPNLKGGTARHKAGTGKGTGASDLEGWTGQKTASGTDMQILTRRYKIDNQGILTMFFTPVFADNAAALSGGLTAGMEYRTSTGVKMEVY